MKNDAFAEAIKKVGSSIKLAKTLGVSKSIIGHWLHGKRPVPLVRAIEIEQATTGEIKAEELYPKAEKQIAYLRSTGVKK